MMTPYAGLFTQAELDEMEAQGYVRSNEHPDFYEMWILNYTEKAAFEGVWNNVTLNCRGLIVDAFGNIIARPFPKFFNYGQPGCPEINLDELAVVSDKMDGSLGISYRGRDGKYYIATRGSFTSDQAIKATEILRKKYPDWQPAAHRHTYLFEIVYPENRIVCNYGDVEDLVFLGAVNIDTGQSYDADYADLFWWTGPKAEVFPYDTMRQALEAEPRPNSEGFVVHLLDSDVRVKIKQEDYIALHKIVTGLNARTVWQAMVDGAVDELIEKVPDEFHDFVEGVIEDIDGDVNESVMIAHRAYDRILAKIGVNPSKKDFALEAKTHAMSWALFQLWDGKDVRREFLKRAKPAHDYSPVKVSNDAD
jgi:RNA ligase